MTQKLPLPQLNGDVLDYDVAQTDKINGSGYTLIKGINRYAKKYNDGTYMETGNVTFPTVQSGQVMSQRLGFLQALIEPNEINVVLTIHTGNPYEKTVSVASTSIDHCYIQLVAKVDFSNVRVNYHIEAKWKSI